MKPRLLLFLKGLAMGSCDVVPGVSGGTIAFITGIYQELLDSLKSFDLKAIKLLFSFRLSAFWSHINGSFLLVLFAGIATAVISFARLVVYLLANQPVMLWAFFFGLILASALVMAKQVTEWKWVSLLTLLAGFVLAFYISSLQTVATPDTSLWYIFVCGMVAICAMILPGISGSFILLLMGGYQLILGTLNDLISSIATASFSGMTSGVQLLLTFAIGAVTGLLSFSHLLSWLFKRYYNQVLTLLIGFLLGSLNKVWPWKKELEALTDKYSLEENVSPLVYEAATGAEPLVVPAILLAVVGFGLVYGIEWWSQSVNQQKG